MSTYGFDENKNKIPVRAEADTYSAAHCDAEYAKKAKFATVTLTFNVLLDNEGITTRTVPLPNGFTDTNYVVAGGSLRYQQRELAPWYDFIIPINTRPENLTISAESGESLGEYHTANTFSLKVVAHAVSSGGYYIQNARVILARTDI